MSRVQCKVCRKFYDPIMTSRCPYCHKMHTSSDSRRNNNMPYMQDVYDPDPTPHSSSDDSFSGGGGSFGGGGSSGSWDSGSSDSSSSSDSGSSSD